MSKDKNADNTAKDIRFTTQWELLYDTVLHWLEDRVLNIYTLKRGGLYYKKEIEPLSLLGYDDKLTYEVDNKSI